ncbi:MAG TPA: DCC1-like thiol-disulfide oxidoreductase family protein [Polyangium sp.]|nr:DCC1-like thiol-disulfide oxidoreductase family protein [Polyangium sp.]
MKRLTVLYDESCALCVRCRDWLLTQEAYVELELLACGSDEAKQRYAGVPWLGEELVVVSDEGDVWAGAAAFLLCLWALVEWRPWSYRLSGPTFAPLAERFFHALSSKRRTVAAWIAPDDCPGGSCRVRYAGGHYR